MKNITKKLIFTSFILILSVVFANLALANSEERSSISSSSESSKIVKSSNVRTSNSQESNSIPIPTAPTIISITVKNITTNSATLSGTVNPNGATTNAWYEVSNGVINKYQNIGSGTVSVNLNDYTLNNLSINTKYSFRIVANNSLGTTYSNWYYFFTTNQSNNSPIIVSTQVNKITENSATLSGSVNPNNISTFAWYEISSGISTSPQKVGNGNTTTNLASYNLTGLKSDTVYKFRIVANHSVNSLGVVYGPWISFTTLNNSSSGGSSGGGGGYVYVSVTTADSGNITKNSANLSGSVITHGLATTTWFEYSTSGSLYNSNQTNHVYLNSNNYASPFSQNITGLSPNTTYYFRAVANAPSGTRYGNILSFRTSPGVIVNSNPGQNGQNGGPTVIAEDNNGTNLSINSPEEQNLPENQENYLAASSIFGNGTFLPTTLLGWILLLIILFIIFVLIRKIIKTSSRKTSKEKSADHIENLPF